MAIDEKRLVIWFIPVFFLVANVALNSSWSMPLLPWLVLMGELHLLSLRLHGHQANGKSETASLLG